MDLEEIGINAGNWINSAQDTSYWRAFVNVALNHGSISHGVRVSGGSNGSDNIILMQVLL